MVRKKTIDELRIEREKAEQDLKLRQENLKKLKAKEADLTRNARTHRLCTHGAMLERFDSSAMLDEAIQTAGQGAIVVFVEALTASTLTPATITTGSTGPGLLQLRTLGRSTSSRALTASKR